MLDNYTSVGSNLSCKPTLARSEKSSNEQEFCRVTAHKVPEFLHNEGHVGVRNKFGNDNIDWYYILLYLIVSLRYVVLAVIQATIWTRERKRRLYPTRSHK